MDRRQGLSRRQVLGLGAAAGAAVAVGRVPLAAAARADRLDFTALAPRDGWPGWTCAGVANLRCRDGRGILEAGSDVFPSDPRPVAFAVDRRFRDGEVSARVTATGAGTGLVLRRVGHRLYYAAILDDEAGPLVILRRAPEGAVELARSAVLDGSGPLRLTFGVRGTRPALLVATLEDGGGTTTVSAEDSTPALQRGGDPGVLATARTLFPSSGPEAFPALGNVHLLPWGVQEGQAVMRTAVGEQVLAAIRERSTAVFTEIELRPASRVGVTTPAVVAATNGPPVRGGARLRVATDVPARVEIEVADNPRFRGSRRLAAGATDDFDAAVATVRALRPGRRVYWRARVRRRRRETVGPVRSFRPLPRAGQPGPLTVAVGSCASQFGPVFDLLARERPDVFVWHGDLNYPDTVGPLAQTVPGYAGIWRDFLGNPRTAPLLEQSLFVVQRDDHDYGLQDANAANLVEHGLTPWESLMEPRTYFRFAAGLAEFWILDQRRFKSDPGAPDTPEKTLLGSQQREWLLRTLARSRAPFKVICSPCTLAPLPANARDGSWAAGFTAERDLLLAHIAARVRGRCLFVTGDTHWTMAYDRDGLLEARPCPLGIPTPNDVTLTQPDAAEEARRRPGVAYADDDLGHFALIEVSGSRTAARLDLVLVREDGARPFERRFEVPRR
ncbi:MAG TPA: alkaline phosphatase D family protein [Solirubrobacteraceae bacterium]|nr:alkaline phosphatase D family protein [Solirubrobacteraceae bacterium]